ncbi:MAG: hypothetical protein NTV94_16470, partial [Planctomycetota bacterium]|nr:hypothetical protein [Planctomycetota bacterium]
PNEAALRASNQMGGNAGLFTGNVRIEQGNLTLGGATISSFNNGISAANISNRTRSFTISHGAFSGGNGFFTYGNSTVSPRGTPACIGISDVDTSTNGAVTSFSLPEDYVPGTPVQFTIVYSAADYDPAHSATLELRFGRLFDVLGPSVALPLRATGDFQTQGLLVSGAPMSSSYAGWPDSSWVAGDMIQLAVSRDPADTAVGNIFIFAVKVSYRADQ